MNIQKLVILLLSIYSLGLNAQNAPIDFESSGNGAQWNWTVFENSSNPPLEFVANPDVSAPNVSATVAKFTATATGAPFAGCETMHGADIGTFTIDSDNMIIRIMVWKSVISNVGIKLVRDDNWSLGELLVSNTVIDQWEQLTFDFSSHLGLTYDQIVVFPDFADRNEDHVIYFDNIMGPEAIETAIEYVGAGPSFKLSPNPVRAKLSIQSAVNIDLIRIYGLAGNIVKSVLASNTTNITMIDLEDVENGVYLIEVIAEGNSSFQKFMKL